MGEGSLTKLEKLKAEYADGFRAAAPKVKRIDVPCFRVRCSTALNPDRLKFSWRGVRLTKATCTRKTCPLATLERYKEMLNRTRAFRQRNDDPASRAFWWEAVKSWKKRFRRERG